MSRELNRDIFGDMNAAIKPNAEKKKSTIEAPVSAEDMKLFGFQVESMSRKLKDLESKFEVLASKCDELTSSTKLKFERVQAHFQRQGESMTSNFRETNSKVATIATKLNERKLHEINIKEMVERHQQVVQAFELRLQQMQKVITEQEYQLMNSRAELKDALKELAKIKKL